MNGEVGGAEHSEGDPRSTELLLVTDIGSTTTKGLLLRRTEDDDGYSFVAMADSATTVERPDEDVGIGVRRVIEALEASSGEQLSRSGGMPSVPYLTTSSAGGGLQMLVVGLTSTETGRIAENTACGAGGVVLRTVTIDDSLSAVEKMMHIQELHPDMILMAGGTDGGDIAGVVRLAELLKLADPQSKFHDDMRIPLVFCGNPDARDFIGEVLRGTFDVHIVDNVRPSMTVLNLEPARNEVHDLFMENVMERAPGYAKLKDYTVSDILPTPAAVERIMELYSDSTGEDTVMMDMGGATTDVFSRIGGVLTRTVAANTGMSYSISNILAECGIDAIMADLPEGFDPGEVRNYIYNKTLSPVSVPSDHGEELVEQAAAIEGARSAWRDHLDICWKNTRIGFQDRRKLRNRKKFSDVFAPVNEDHRIDTSGVSLVIGAGGVISHMSRTDALRVLTEGFLPEGLTRIAVDRHFRSPHMGILSTLDPKMALELFGTECLEDVGWVVAPVGPMRTGEPALSVRDLGTGSESTVSGGEVLLMEKGGDLRFRVHGSSLQGLPGDLRTDLPVLLDCRGRHDDYRGPSITSSVEGTDSTPFNFISSLRPSAGTVTRGPWELEYRLPYEGDVLVSEGDPVTTGSVLGENRFDPPRLYVIDLNRIPGYGRHLTPEEIREGLLLNEDDEVRTHQALYEVRRHGIAGFDFTFRSPVRGRITRIETNGLIIVREIQDYDEKPHVVDISGPLGIKPKHIRSCLKVRKDDFVTAGQCLASDLGRNIFVMSPTTGMLREIDTSTGTVTVQYDIRPVRMLCNVEGTVSKVVPGRSVTVQGDGAVLSGVIGFGGRCSGRLTRADSIAEVTDAVGSVLFSTVPLDRAYLMRAAEVGAAGIIAPSIEASQWIEYNGNELGVALTGDEEIPFTLVLTSGFGRMEMTPTTASFMSEMEGRIVGLSGMTQVRTGVTRPSVVICD